MTNGTPPQKAGESFPHGSAIKRKSKIDILHMWAVKNHNFSERTLVEQAMKLFQCSRKSGLFYARCVRDRATLFAGE